MNNLLFYTALVLIALYFFYYHGVSNSGTPFDKGVLPQSNKTSPSPRFKNSQTVSKQPENDEPIFHCPGSAAIPNPETITRLENEISTLKTDQKQKEQTIIGLNSSYEKLENRMEQQNQTSAQTIKDLKQQVSKLQSEIRDLVKRPLKPTSSKSTQTSDTELTNTLDTLIKSIQELNNSL